MITQTQDQRGQANTTSGADIVRKILVVLAVVAIIVVNGLANALPINGQQTGEISDRFDVYFTPAGYVFSIWGLIYFGMAAYGVYQALPSQRANPRLRNTGYLFILSSLANIAWILLWHYEFFALSLVAMAVLLLSLIAVYLRLGTGRTTVSRAENWLVRVPFSLYLGWITVATIANATVVLDYGNWNALGIAPEVWAVIMMVVAAIVGLVFSFTRGDIAYVLVIGWALVGIAVKNSDTPGVAMTASALAAIVVLSLFAGVPRNRWRLMESEAYAT